MNRRAAAQALTVLLLAAAGCDPAPAPKGAGPVVPSLSGSAPLAPPSPPGATLFALVPPEESGLSFVHRWEPAGAHQAQQLSNATAGGGVAVGDYDGDGRPDVFLTRPFGGCRLYHNLGDFKFEDVTARAGLDRPGWGTGACFVDVDNDGDLDLAVCHYGEPNRLWINGGTGTFTEEAVRWGLAYSGASIMLAFADYDKDGLLDAYLLTNVLLPPGSFSDPKGYYELDAGGRLKVRDRYRGVKAVVDAAGDQRVITIGQPDRLYRRRPGGGFQDVTSASGIAGDEPGLGVVWSDFDSDEDPDLYVANDLEGADRLWRNNGDGTFTDASREAFGHTPWFSMGCDAGDIDGDRRPDVVATDMAGPTHYKAKVGMGDMSERGWFLTWTEPRQAMQNCLFINTGGGGRFLEAAQMAGIAATDWTWSPRLMDLDGDGLLDLFVTTGMTRDWFNSDLMRREREVRERVGHLEFWEALGPKKEPNLAFRNLGEMAFEEVGRGWGLDHSGVSFGAAFGDFDGDGDPDLVVNNFGEAASLYRNGSTGHRLKLRLVGQVSNRMALGTRVAVVADGQVQFRELTSARGYASSDEPALFFGFGQRRPDEIKVEIVWPTGVRGTSADYEIGKVHTIEEHRVHRGLPRMGEGSSTIVAEPIGPAGIRHQERPFNDFAAQPLLPNKLSQLGPGVAVGDVDGDGRDDLVVGGAAGRPATVALNRGGGVWKRVPSAPLHWDAACEDMGVLLLEANGDGKQDLLIVSGSNEFAAGALEQRDRLYLGDGRGGFAAAPEGALPDDGQIGGAAAAADVDRDGDLDLFIGSRVRAREYPTSPPSRLLKNAGGRFELVQELEAGMVTGAVWSDADGDGRVDLVVAAEYAPVRLYRNRQGVLAAGEPIGPSGWWNGIAARDLDNDGDIDYALTNAGLNTRYRASAERPQLLYYGRFDADSGPQIVEAGYEGEHLVPIRGRSCSTAAIQGLGPRVPTFHDFAARTLPELYGAEALAGALRLEATELRSGALLNDGAGRFRFEPFPWIAQISPGFGIVATELDGDGAADVALAQNFFTPQPETPRMDGGVGAALLGIGNGRFKPWGEGAWGLGVSGDAKGLACGEFNGDGGEDLVVTQNDGELRVLDLALREPKAVLRVRLEGPPGNPTAAGARVTLVRSDGVRQTGEVAAGAGYLSQSSATLAFGLGKGRPEALEVLWPDGTRTSRKLPADATGVWTEVRK